MKVLIIILLLFIFCVYCINYTKENEIMIKKDFDKIKIYLPDSTVPSTKIVLKPDQNNGKKIGFYELLTITIFILFFPLGLLF